MFKFIGWGAVSAALMLAGCGTPAKYVKPLGASTRSAPAPTPAPAITWEVQNRFRLLKGQVEEERFYRDLSAHTLEYDVWFKREDDYWRPINYIDPDLIHPDGYDKPRPGAAAPTPKTPPRDYAVNYDVRTHSYLIAKPKETDWIRDPGRTVLLTAANLGAGKCVWTIAGQTGDPKPCADKQPQGVELGTAVEVSVRALESGAEAHETVLVKDIKIVALGDSFSAGEGNPHTQWRSLGGRDRPATWLDPRCHRSLVSGPSLAAAYVARANPHLTVTLLHYGCSGASIYDGLVTPWSLLETAQRANRRWVDRGYDVAEMPPSQVAASLGPYDIAPSQIDMAVRDLSYGGLLVQPDVVLLSVGGNDVGFARIVGGLARRSPDDVDGDLHAKPTPDERKVITFDDAAWKAADQGRECPREGVICMGQRVKGRVPGMLHDNTNPARVTGFDVVASQLKRLATPAGAVYLTQYPNFVMRGPNGSGQRSPPVTGDLVGCNDAPFDGRPNLVPSVLALLPNAGMRGKDAEKSDAEFMGPINGALGGAKTENGWTLVDRHLTQDRGHGFCGSRRYFNTFVDSHWTQGSTYRGSRPMGNFVVWRGDDRKLPVGTRVVWDQGRGCFAASPEPNAQSLRLIDGDCLRDENGQDPIRYALDRKAPDLIDQGGIANTTGSVHPNLFGHCSYAAAIVATMAETQLPKYGDLLAPTFIGKAKTLNAETLCVPEAWDYEKAGKPHASQASASPHGG